MNAVTSTKVLNNLLTKIPSTKTELHSQVDIAQRHAANNFLHVPSIQEIVNIRLVYFLKINVLNHCKFDTRKQKKFKSLNLPLPGPLN